MNEEAILLIPIGLVIALVYFYSDEIFGFGDKSKSEGEDQ